MKANLFSAIDASVAGLRSQRYRMNVIAENLANVQTTRTATGNPYRRKEVLLASGNPAPDFSFALNSAYEKYAQLTHQDVGKQAGVRVLGTVEDQSNLREKYEPGHPDADEEGIVRLPNVNPVVEMVNMLSTSRSYESNIAALNTSKRMAEKALEIGT